MVNALNQTKPVGRKIKKESVIERKMGMGMKRRGMGREEMGRVGYRLLWDRLVGGGIILFVSVLVFVCY